MDPNETLRRLLELVRQSNNAEIVRDHASDMVSEYAELVEALNGWLIKGGTLPDIWCRDLEREHNEAASQLGRGRY